MRSWLHNDDYTTQEFVVYVLMKSFSTTPRPRSRLMLTCTPRAWAWPGSIRATSPRPKPPRWCAMPATMRCLSVVRCKGNHARPGAGAGDSQSAGGCHAPATRVLGPRALLLALLDDQKTTEVIRECGGKPARVRARLEEFLEGPLPKLPADDQARGAGEEGELRAQPTLGFARVIQACSQSALWRRAVGDSRPACASGPVQRARLARGGTSSRKKASAGWTSSPPSRMEPRRCSGS